MATAGYTGVLMQNGKVKVWLPAIRTGGGADVFTLRLAAALERHGLAAHITWFPWYCELLTMRLQQAVPPIGTDIILANSWSGFAFRHTGLPLVVTVHHRSFSSGLSPYKNLAQRIYHRFIAEPRERRSVHSADAITAVSAFVAEGLRGQYGIEKVAVIHNWVDTARFQPAPDESNGYRPFRLLFVGKPSRLKGADMLVRLMRKLGSGFELQVTADAAACRKMNCPENVHPIGRLAEDELVRAYQRCDAVLLPSRSEGFGYVALEAMACGKPVVASDNTALPEIIVDGTTGFLCQTDDIDGFAEACRRLSADPELCASMGRSGRQHAVRKFSESAAVVHYLTLIKRLVTMR